MSLLVSAGVPSGHFAARIVEVLVAGYVASWTALLLHELGHAVTARLLGVGIWDIRLGMGPVLWQGRLGGARIRLALLPLLGSVRLLDSDASAIGYRDIECGTWRFEWGPKAWRAPLISAAGGLGNLLGVLVAIVLWDRVGQPSSGSLSGDVLLFTMVANFGGYLNLIPCFHSDGAHLLAHVRAARLRMVPGVTA